jgi:hypothetical protein
LDAACTLYGGCARRHHDGAGAIWHHDSKLADRLRSYALS